jgi:TIR domain/Domain of unknown function (DUF4062)
MSALPSTRTVQSFTRTYEVDVFLSYGHIDNQENWVTQFHSRLQTRLQELLGTEDVVVWRDPKLAGNDCYDDLLRDKVSHSAVFISVLSPRYTQSDSCRKELDWFVEATQRTGGLRVDTKSRLIKVTKTRLSEEMVPANFQDTLGFQFYETDSQNQEIFHEFDAGRGMPRFIQFHEQCDRLAQAVERMLRKMRHSPSSKPASGRTVFLARTSSDLEPRRAAIRSELTDRGHNVLPADPLPDSGPEMKAAAELLLAKSDISVHLFGLSYGVIPEQETRSFGELQYELAIAQRQRPGFHQLIWIPEDLRNPEERQQAFLNQLRESGDQTAAHRADLFQTSFESFKEGLLDVLSRKPEAPPPVPGLKSKAVYLLCNQSDLRRDPLDKIKAFLRSRGHPVELPPFDGTPEELRELEDELIGDTDAALIYYGTAKDAWVIAKRKNLRKVLGTRASGRNYARALYLCTPRDDKKADYLSVPDHLFLEPEPQGFPPLLVLGDCGDFEPGKLDAFLNLIEKEP